MLLAIDVGNTNIVLGVFRGERLLQSWRLATLRERTADEIGLMALQLFEHHAIKPSEVSGVIIASVVPPLTGTMAEMAERYIQRKPLLVEPATRIGMDVLYENPSEVGADRLVNGVAAYEKYGRAEPRPVIIVDFGTATTFDVITAQGEYLGGAICPGVQISADALFQRAARLPRIEVRKPAQVIGRTTVGSMQAGLFYGYVGLVEGLVQRLRRELTARAVTVATGGLASVIAPETTVIDHIEPDLTLHGMRLVWERNC
jgi:type III pantothenate kinase